MVQNGLREGLDSEKTIFSQFKTQWTRDFPDGPVVETHASTAGGMGSLPVWGTKLPTCCLVWPKKKKKKYNGLKTSTTSGKYWTSGIVVPYLALTRC